MQIVRSPRKPSDAALVVTSFESPTAEIIARHYPFKERAALYVTVALVVAVFVFISIARLDRVVAAKGRVVPTGGALTVQPLEKAIINRVLVSVGDVVKKGQVLATCDPTFVQADLAAAREKVASLEAQKRRMELEEAGKSFHPDASRPSEVFQSSVMQQRSTEFDAGVQDFDQRIRSAEAQIAGFKQSIADLRARLKIAKETEDMYAKMEKDGIATHLDLIGMQDKTLDMTNQLSEQESSLAAAEHLLESLKEQRKVFVDKWHDDNLDKLTVVRDDYQQAVNDLAKAEKMSQLVNLVSPVDAIVLKIPSLSTGGVAMDAEPLFSLMPVDTPIEIDAHIDTQDSGFVKTGQRARIKFDAYQFLEHGTGEGVVKTISQDSFTEVDDQDTVSKNDSKPSGAPYYDARITLTGLHLHNVPPNLRVIPGMTLEADIVVGSRTIIWYLFGGALRSGADAMQEP